MMINKHFILTIFLALGISLCNFWIYRIYEYNFFIGELLIIETLLLFLSTRFKDSSIISIFIFFILAILSIFLISGFFDKNIFSVSTMESIHIQEKKQFYAQELGKIYKNKIGIFYFNNFRLVFNKISNNFFSALDLSLYFSPKPLIENEKYPLILAPLFITGFLVLLITPSKAVSIIYLILALFQNSLINLDSKLGPLLMFPFVSLCLSLGFISLLKRVKNLYRKNI